MITRAQSRSPWCCWLFRSFSSESSTCWNNGRAVFKVNMAGNVKRKSNGDSHRQSRRGTEESPIVKWVLISIALAFCMVFLLLPLVNVFAQAFSQGAKAYVAALTDADSW